MTRPPCAALWETPMVHTDGRLTTCCLDEGMQNVLGSLRDATLAELWWGSTVERWRLAQIEGRFQDSGPFCTRCEWQSAGGFPPDKVQQYLKNRAQKVKEPND